MKKIMFRDTKMKKKTTFCFFFSKPIFHDFLIFFFRNCGDAFFQNFY